MRRKLLSLSLTISLVLVVSGARAQSFTQAQAVTGLKEALELASGRAAGRVGLVDGFLKNEVIKILLPEEAKVAADYLQKRGGKTGKTLVDSVLIKMNRAAEQAARNPATKQIFVDAIRTLTISDGLQLLRGDSTAATTLLQSKTQVALSALFAPIIKAEMQKNGLDKAWTNLSTRYNQLAQFSTNKKALPTDISQHVTTKALSGVFWAVGQEEKKIRRDPKGQATGLVQSLFGSLTGKN
jgi:Protein of unknown function (DUF4197)